MKSSSLCVESCGLREIEIANIEIKKKEKKRKKKKKEKEKEKNLPSETNEPEFFVSSRKQWDF